MSLRERPSNSAALISSLVSRRMSCWVRHAAAYARAATGLVALMVTPCTVDAQRRPEPAPGTRARVVSFDNHGNARTVTTGTLLRLSGDSAIISAQTDSAVVPHRLNRHNILQISRGTRGNAGVGALAGVFGGVLLGAVLPCKDEGGFGAPSCSDMRPVVMGMLGLLGAGVGALVGNAHRTEHWQTVRP